MCSDEKKLGAENDITEVYNNLRPRLHIVEKLVSCFCLQEKTIHLRGRELYQVYWRTKSLTRKSVWKFSSYPSNIMVDHFTKLWLLVSWRFLKLQGKPWLTDGTCLFYSDDTFYRYISVENFPHNSVSVACGKLIAARYTARHRRQGILQAIQARLCWWTLTFHSSLFHLHFRLFALQWSALS